MNTLQLLSDLFVPNNYKPEDNLPYHRFNAYDYEKLLNPTDDGQIFVFKNQNAEVLKFKLIKSTLGKKTFKTETTNNYNQKHFCFDEQVIQLQCIETNAKLTYNLKKFPSKIKSIDNGFQFGNHSTFVATILFPIWNENNLILIDYSKPLSTLIINGVFYTKVRVLDVSQNLRLYFDTNKGIIGFDDANGNIWRISN